MIFHGSGPQEIRALFLTLFLNKSFCLSFHFFKGQDGVPKYQCSD